MTRIRRFFGALACTIALSTQMLGAQETPVPSPSPTPAATPSATPSETPSPQPSATPAGAPSPTPVPAPLVATPNHTASNIGVPQTINIAGSSGTLTATLDPKIASVAVNGTAITLGPIRNGNATLHVVDPATNASVDVPVRVAPNAGTVAQQILLKVTGQSVDPAFIASQAALALARETKPNPGASVQAGQIVPPAMPLGVGAQTTLNVPVAIAGGDQYLDVRGTSQIVVQNVPAAPFDPLVLFYSDDPERILNDGVLYRGTVTALEPVRLYDYHENGQQPRRLVVALSGSSTATSTVQMIESFAGPNMDVMTVGHVVTRNFLLNKPRDQGLVVDVTGDAPYFQRDVPMTNRQGVASSTDFKVLSGGPVTLTVLAVSPGVNPATLLAGSVLPGDGKNRRGVFSLANYGAQKLAYAAGAADVSTNLGDREPTIPKTNPSDPGRDWGDYGVLFDLSFALSNPSDAPQTVYLYESARGGPARAAYLIDAEAAPVELGCATSAASVTSPPHRYLIRAFTLAPRASETHTVRTMTDGGSNLPLEVGVTGVQPQASTPPIGAPDGCFPKPQPVSVPSPTPSPEPEPTP